MLESLLVVMALEGQGAGGVDRVFAGRDFVLVLGTNQGPCAEGEKIAVFATNEAKTPGCWFEKSETIWVKWGDGTLSAVPSVKFHRPKEA